jgi:hypothetical protein
VTVELSGRSHRVTKLRWKIDALPDPTQLTENPISAEVEVRPERGITTVPGILVRMVSVRVIEVTTVGARVPGLDRTIRVGATAVPMEDSERTVDDVSGLASSIRQSAIIAGGHDPGNLHPSRIK